MNTITPKGLGCDNRYQDRFGWIGCAVTVTDENGKAVKGTITGLSASDYRGGE